MVGKVSGSYRQGYRWIPTAATHVIETAVKNSVSRACAQSACGKTRFMTIRMVEMFCRV